MNLSKLFRICRIYGNLGTAMEDGVDEVVIAHENFLDNDEAFEEFLSEYNYNTIDRIIEPLEEISSVLGEEFDDLTNEIGEIIERMRRMMNYE